MTEVLYTPGQIPYESVDLTELSTSDGGIIYTRTSNTNVIMVYSVHEQRICTSTLRICGSDRARYKCMSV